MSLYEACQQADIDQVKRLIEQKCDITEINEDGRTALHFCCDHRNLDGARLLLENNSIKATLLNAQDNEGFSALHLDLVVHYDKTACLNGNQAMVKFLCEQDADVSLVDNESHSLIHWATVCGHLDLFDILIEYKVPIHTADIYEAFPIHYASQLSGSQDQSINLAILKKLIDNNADVDCLDEKQRTPFMWAANANAIEALRVLYKAGANPLHIDKDSLTALHCAATCGHGPCIRMLIELYDCPIEKEDVNGCTALFYAMSFEHLNACRILLDLKANPNHQDNRGRTPSHCVAFKANIECVKVLIEHGGNIWIKNVRGDYPIHETITAVSCCKENDKLTELKSKCVDFVRYVFELYPDQINIQNNEQRTPLHLAASIGDIDMCKALIEYGAQVNSFIRTAAGNFLTPYDLACIRHQEACANYLLVNHGGQRGNLLAQIQARRIQRCFRRRQSKQSEEELPLPQPIIETNVNTDRLLSQAKICLDNKRIDDQLDIIRRNSLRVNTYLKVSPKQEKKTAQQRRHLFAESKKNMTPIYRSEEKKSNSFDRVIVQTPNSVATSVKLYERHRTIAEELFKIREARLLNHSIIINRSLYKILIENAFNPKNRPVSEIEKYLERLLKAYENELEAMRKRTRSVSSRPCHNHSNRKTSTQS